MTNKTNIKILNDKIVTTLSFEAQKEYNYKLRHIVTYFNLADIEPKPCLNHIIVSSIKIERQIEIHF